MPLDGTTYKQDPEVEEHPAAVLTPSERAKAIAYLERLDAYWDKHGADGWLKGTACGQPSRQVGKHAEASCLYTFNAGHCDGSRPAMKALGFDDLGSAWTWNDAATTTFAMVHTRVKDTLAVLRGLG